jgi:flagellar hook-associated protein 3 FlgL
MGFRITQSSIARSVMFNLQGGMERNSRLQEQLSSGRQLNRPSDSPTQTVSALQFRSQIRRTEQHVRNANDAQGWLAAADTALTSSLDITRRARELVIRGINDSMSATDREAIAKEVEGLRESLIGIANTTYLDRPVFAGTAAGPDGQPVPAYAPDGTFTGDTGQVRRTVAPGVTVQVNVTGPEAFGSGGTDIFSTLTEIANRLRTDHTTMNADVLPQLDDNIKQVLTTLAGIGARYNRVETVKANADEHVVTLRSGLSETEDIDLPKTVMELKLQEVAYQAALAATARVIQPSLVEFLR